MRILHVIDHLGPGGAQRIVMDLMATHGSDVEPVVCSLSRRALPHLVEELRACGVVPRFLGFPRPDALGRLRSEVATVRPDVLHVHLDWSGTLGPMVAASLGERRPRAVVAGIANDPLTRYSRLHRTAGRLLAPAVDAHVAVSPSLAAATRRAYRRRIRRLEVIEPGIDVRRWTAFDPTPDAARRVAELRGGARRVVGAVGRLAPQKAFHRLIEAMPALLRAEPSTRALIVGEGPLRQHLADRTRALGVEAAVVFTGHLADPRPAFRAMDVFVLPSLDEGFGIVSVEAMASGVPVVATRVIGTVDAVRHEQTGVLLDSGEPAALAAAVLRVLQDEELAARLRREGRAFAERHSREAATAAFETLYRELLAPSASAAGLPAEHRTAARVAGGAGPRT